jgi:hypothetical protein
LTFTLLLRRKGKWVVLGEELDLQLFLWLKDKWVVLGEELDLHPFPAPTLSLGGFCAPLAVHNRVSSVFPRPAPACFRSHIAFAVHSGVFRVFSPFGQRGQTTKKEGLMMKCAKLFVVGMMLAGLVVAGA